MALWLCEAVRNATLLSRKLSIAWLATHGAVVRRTASWLLVCDNVVCSSSVAASTALAVGYVLVRVVWIRILEDNIPGVEEPGKEGETAKRNVDERVGAADSFLHPYTDGWELVDVSVAEAVNRTYALGVRPLLRRRGTYQDAEKHQEAVGATHYGDYVSFQV